MSCNLSFTIFVIHTSDCDEYNGVSPAATDLSRTNR